MALTPENEEVHRLNKDLVEELFANPEAGPDDFKRIYEEFLQKFAIPEGAVFEEVDAGGVPSIWCVGQGSSDARTIVHFHSGGYVIGSATGYRQFGARLSEATGARVLMVDYRLAPEHPFPAPADDAIAAVRWVRAQGIDARDLILSGDSAGGGLVMITLQGLRDAGEELPAAGVCMSPYADLAITGDSVTENAGKDPLVTPDLIGALAAMYVGENDPKDPRISPLYGDMTGLPPLLMMAGDIEVIRDDGKRMVAKAQEAGVDATWIEEKDMVHIWPIFSDRLQEGRDTLEKVARFIEDKTSATVT